MTRVIAGAARGRRLQTPPGTATRPTSDRAREGLFSALGDLTGLRLLDLYAGSGAVGLEALSRGAEVATMVELDVRAAAVITANAAALALPGSEVVQDRVERFLSAPPTAYDVVFLDPPYAEPVADVLALAMPWIGDRVVVERATRDKPLEWPEGLSALRSRRYGEATLWYGRRP